MGKHRKKQGGNEPVEADIDIRPPKWNRDASPEEKGESFDRYQDRLDAKTHRDYMKMGPVDRAYHTEKKKWL